MTRKRKVGLRLRLRPKQKQKRGPKEASTDNGKMISELMHSQNVRGNPKDWTIIAGYRLVDYYGSYDIRLEDGRTTGTKSVVLVHKRNLHKFIGAEMAVKFWRRGIGRVRDGG